MKIGPYIRKAREAKRSTNKEYSLRKVATRLGITAGALSRIETDEEAPSEDLLVRIAADLGIEPDVLLVLAGRIPKRILDVIHKRPALFIQVIDQMAKMPDHAVLRVVREVRDGDW